MFHKTIQWSALLSQVLDYFQNQKLQLDLFCVISRHQDKVFKVVYSAFRKDCCFPIIQFVDALYLFSLIAVTLENHLVHEAKCTLFLSRLKTVTCFKGLKQALETKKIYFHIYVKTTPTHTVCSFNTNGKVHRSLHTFLQSRLSLCFRWWVCSLFKYYIKAQSGSDWCDQKP